MKVNIGISDRNRKVASQILNQLLSDEYVLYTKTRNYHWNVVGPDFSELHKFFEAQYEELNDIVDEVAERARTLGGLSFGSLKEFLTHTKLKETPGATLSAKKMIANLLGDHEAIVQSLRKSLDQCADELGDMGTSDFLTALMEQHEKMAWMLRAYLG
ncbi:MAG: DNA starvation/stationary phase protection protein [Candidatus Omnitrophica bacterium]|nr:DNA starvation/stationary phase protection protein [Candidatus Omnitrophota bacterium]